MLSSLYKGLVVAVVCSTSLALAPVAAQAETDEKAGLDWMVGLGVAVVPDYEGSENYTARPVGVVRVAWDDGRFVEMKGAQSSGAAPRFRANILKKTDVRFGPVLQVRRARDDVENNQVDDMSSIDAALEIGAFAGFDQQRWGANVGLDFTVVGAVKEYSGGLIELAPHYARKVNDVFSFRVDGFGTWASSGYMSTYFGVNASDSARTRLPEYSARKGVKDLGLGVLFNFKGSTWEHWRISVLTRYARLIGHADDSSPVTDVGSENQLFGGVVVTYDN